MAPIPSPMLAPKVSPGDFAGVTRRDLPLSSDNQASLQPAAVELTIDDLLAEELDVSFDTAPLKERRRSSPRVSIAVEATMDGDEPTYWKGLNLSNGGIFLTGEPVLRQNEVFQLSFWLPKEGGVDKISCKVRVAWVLTQTGRNNSTSRGMGVEFLELPETDALKVEAFVSASANSRASGDTSPEHDGTLKPHTRIGPYEIISLAGQGGMSEVYLATHTALGKKVGLKRLAQRFVSDPTLVSRFLGEARRASQLHHPNIIEINDFISIGNNHLYAMEFLEGEDLAERISRTGAFERESLMRISRQLCDALHAVHAAGIVHRDLKPGNVFLVATAEHKDHVKLLDFGISKTTAVNAPKETAVGIILGTPGYMAPEQILGDDVDYRADIYCFGLILFEMIAGEQPFVADTLPKLLYQHAVQPPTSPGKLTRAHIPERLKRLVLSCLEKNPDDRPQSMADIKAELLAAETDPGQRVVLPTSLRQKPKGGSGTKRIAAVFAIATLALGAWYLASTLASQPELNALATTLSVVPAPSPDTPTPDEPTTPQTAANNQAAVAPAAKSKAVATPKPQGKPPKRKRKAAGSDSSFFDLY